VVRTGTAFARGPGSDGGPGADHVGLSPAVPARPHDLADERLRDRRGSGRRGLVCHPITPLLPGGVENFSTPSPSQPANDDSSVRLGQCGRVTHALHESGQVPFCPRDSPRGGLVNLYGNARLRHAPAARVLTAGPHLGARRLELVAIKPSQRAMCAAKMAGLPRGTNQHRKEDPSIDVSSIDEAAKIFFVSSKSVERALAVLRDGCKALVLSDTPYSLPITAAVLAERQSLPLCSLAYWFAPVPPCRLLPPVVR
jgi:hypothetical protein